MSDRDEVLAVIAEGEAAGRCLNHSAFEAVSASANPLSEAGYEYTVLAITASYLAGKEAGKREGIAAMAEQIKEKRAV